MLTLPQLQILLQVVSSCIIGCGLVYAGLQFRHWRRVARVGNFTRLVELQMELRRMRVEDPSLAHVYRHDVEGHDSPQEIREYFLNLMQLSVFEIVWFSHREGQLPHDYFLSWERRIREIASEGSFRKMIGSPSMKILHDDFQAYVIELVRRTPPREQAAEEPEHAAQLNAAS